MTDHDKKGFRHWNGSEWVTFSELQPGHQLHHDEKGADAHNKKLANASKEIETPDLIDTEPVENIAEKETSATKKHKGGK